jgi:hypothetical protein
MPQGIFLFFANGETMNVLDRDEARETFSALMVRRGCEEIARFGQLCLEAEIHVVEFLSDSLEAKRREAVVNLENGGKMVSLFMSECQDIQWVLRRNHVVRLDSFAKLAKDVLDQSPNMYTSEMKFWQDYCRAVNPFIAQFLPTNKTQ